MSEIRPPQVVTGNSDCEVPEPILVPTLVQIRAGLEMLRDSLTTLATKIEKPILEVGAFLESIQELDSARPFTGAGSRLVMALQSYDMFHQEIALAEDLIGLLTMAMDENEGREPVLPAPAMLANAESVFFHLDSARTLIINAADDIPHAVSQVLQGAGASPRKFQHWSINRSLAEIGLLTAELAKATDRVDMLRRRLAGALGEDPDVRHMEAPPQADFENSSVTLF